MKIPVNYEFLGGGFVGAGIIDIFDRARIAQTDYLSSIVFLFLGFICILFHNSSLSKIEVKK